MGKHVLFKEKKKESVNLRAHGGLVQKSMHSVVDSQISSDDTPLANLNKQNKVNFAFFESEDSLMTDEGLKNDHIFNNKDNSKADDDELIDEMEESLGLDENLTNRQKLFQKAGEVLEDEREVLKDKVDREIQQLPALKNQAHRIAMKLNLDKE